MFFQVKNILKSNRNHTFKHDRTIILLRILVKKLEGNISTHFIIIY